MILAAPLSRCRHVRILKNISPVECHVTMDSCYSHVAWVCTLLWIFFCVLDFVRGDPLYLHGWLMANGKGPNRYWVFIILLRSFSLQTSVSLPYLGIMVESNMNFCAIRHQIFPTRYLRCSSLVTVSVLKKFVITKFAIPETHIVRILVCGVQPHASAWPSLSPLFSRGTHATDYFSEMSTSEWPANSRLLLVSTDL